MRAPAFLFTLLMTIPALATAQERRPMTTDDGLNMVRVGTGLISPDGSWVLYSRSELDWEKNKRKTTYHRVATDGGDSYQFIGEDGGSNFQFSPDGRFLSFTRQVDSNAQIFLMRTTGGEAVKLTDHKTSVSRYRWARDAGSITFVAAEARPDSAEKEHKAGDDAIFVDEGPNGQTAGTWNNFWAIDLTKREERRITDEEFRIGSFDLSSDGTIAATIRFENRRNQSNLSEIFLIDPASGERTRLTTNQAPESRVQWAPDDVHLSFTAAGDDEWDLRLGKIWVMNTQSRRARMVSGEFEGNINTVTWTRDAGSLLFTGLHRTNANLFRLDIASGRVRQLTEFVGSFRATSFSADTRRMVYSFQSFDTPADLFASEVGRFAPTRLTDANPWITTDLTLAQAEVVQWSSTDGTEIEGLLALPPGYDEGDPKPLLLHIHGGPAGVFTNSFRSSYQVWAGLGYAQLMPNVRGSSGYTDELLRGNMNDIGGGDYQDLMTGVDHVIARGIADPNQLGVRGWSYGGILGGWTITQTDRFKGASVGAMVSDWTSEYGPGFNHDVRLWYIGGTPWENPDDWRERSALTHIANVTTPTLVLHGMNDRTDTEPQSMMFFQALKDQGKTARYLRFPREPHGFREPRHQRRRDIEEIRWIEKYVRGVDWTPWERKPAGTAKKEII